MSNNGEQARSSELQPDNDRFLLSLFELSRSAFDHGPSENRRKAASDLLHKALSFCGPAALSGSIESWNVAQEGDLRFEGDVPILSRPGDPNLLTFYFAVVLLRRALGSVDIRGGQYTDASPSATTWGQFLMGKARKKMILQADLAGVLDGTDEIRITPTLKLESNTDTGDRFRFHLLDVKLGRAFLESLRERHRDFLNHIMSDARKLAEPMITEAGPTGGGMAEYLLAKVLEKGKSHGIKAYQAAGVDVLRDLDESAVEHKAKGQLAKAFGIEADTVGIIPFVRQLILQAFACPPGDAIRAVAFVPDIAFKDFGKRQVVTSTAVQIFLPSPLPPESPLWKMWAAMVSLAGREKSVHDFSRRAEQLGYQQGEYMISHEMDTPISLLNQEREKLSQSGRLAIDYLELWRRHIKREWSDAPPPEMEAVYQSKGALLQTALRLGYARALRRSKIPRRVVDGRLRFWEFDELLQDLDHWLDVNIEIPADVMSGKAPWVFQTKTWLMFQLIGACHHVITFAFGECKRFDDWDAAKKLKRARLDLTSTAPSPNVLRLSLVNTGGPQQKDAAQDGGTLAPIRSSNFGVVQMPIAADDSDRAPDRRRVTVCPPKRANQVSKGVFLWEAWIKIEKEEVSS